MRLLHGGGSHRHACHTTLDAKIVRTPWRKRIAIWRNRLFLYPTPEPLPRTPAFWLATALVALLVLLFSCFFIFYLTGKQDAYMTHSEDLGIMDQAIWKTVHGHLFQPTFRNSLNDTPCYN